FRDRLAGNLSNGRPHPLPSRDLATCSTTPGNRPRETATNESRGASACCDMRKPQQSPMAARPPTLSFDAAAAMRHLSERDDRLGRLIAVNGAFQLRTRGLHSPYEALLEAITYQSIS